MRPTLILAVVLLACKAEEPTPPTQVDPCVVGFADRDGDGFGNPNLRTSACQEAVVDNGDDCDDLFNTAYPGAPEICDGVDNDCDTLIDSLDDELDLPPQFADGDGDLVGAGPPVNACEHLPNHVYVDGDCNDNDPQVLPGQPEICDGVDNNCDGEVDDEDLDDFDFSHAPQWYIDSDGDGYPGPVQVAACVQPPGGGTFSSDCNDANPLSFPGAVEYCNGQDDDCDGQDDFGTSCENWFGPHSGPFTLLMSHDSVYTCSGTLEVSMDFFATPPIQGAYTCTFDGAEGWDLSQSGTIEGIADYEAEVTGTFTALNGEVYNWTGSIQPPGFSGGGGLWLNGPTTWDVEASWELDLPFP